MMNKHSRAHAHVVHLVTFVQLDNAVVVLSKMKSKMKIKVTHLPLFLLRIKLLLNMKLN